MYDELVAEYADLRQNRDDLAAELEACENLRADEHVVRIKQLQFELREVRRTRDTAMNQIVEMGRQIAWWRKQAEKLGWKPQDAKP